MKYSFLLTSLFCCIGLVACSNEPSEKEMRTAFEAAMKQAVESYKNKSQAMLADAEKMDMEFEMASRKMHDEFNKSTNFDKKLSEDFEKERAAMINEFNAEKKAEREKSASQAESAFASLRIVSFKKLGCSKADNGYKCDLEIQTESNAGKEDKVISTNRFVKSESGWALAPQ